MKKTSTLLICLLAIIVMAYAAVQEQQHRIADAMLLHYDPDTLPMPDDWKGTPAQWREFDDCIKEYPSDAVCDSCYTKIMEVNITNQSQTSDNEQN